VRPRSWAVNLFVLGYVAAVAAWSVPAPAQPAAVRQLNRWLEPVMLRSGLWQGWDMFAPDPLAIDVSVEADVMLRDGTWVTWPFPQMETLGYLERYRKERYRKWRERVRLDAYALVWPDTARFVARRVSRPENRARLVQLVRRWEPIPRPVGPHLPPRPSRPVLTREFRFFTYPVAPADLR
jgi:hypothetical protein